MYSIQISNSCCAYKKIIKYSFFSDISAILSLSIKLTNYLKIVPLVKFCTETALDIWDHIFFLKTWFKNGFIKYYIYVWTYWARMIQTIIQNVGSIPYKLLLCYKTRTDVKLSKIPSFFTGYFLFQPESVWPGHPV